VELVTSGIDHLTENAIVTRDGVARPVDVVILATGFQSTAFLAPMAIEGLRGLSLADEWVDGARAYRGMTIPGFPNFFMMYGPNTNNWSGSTVRYWWTTWRFDREHYRAQAREGSSRVAASVGKAQAAAA